MPIPTITNSEMATRVERYSLAALPVTVDEAKTHLRISHSSDDTYIESLIRSVQYLLEPPDGWLNRGLKSGFYITYFKNLSKRLYFSTAPVTAVSAIQYLSESFVWTSLPTQNRYIQYGDNAYIQFTDDFVWPDTIADPRYATERIKVRFSAGYTTIPNVIQQYILTVVAELYRSRTVTETGTVITTNKHIDQMIDQFIYWV